MLTHRQTERKKDIKKRTINRDKKKRRKPDAYIQTEGKI